MIQIEQHDGYHQEQNDTHRHPVDDMLYVQLVQIAVCFLVQLIQTVSLSHQLFPLHLQHLGIIACHQGRHQHSFLLVGLAFENINGQFYDLITVCRIDVGCIKQRVAHQLDAAILTRKAVNATVEWLMAVSC